MQAQAKLVPHWKRLGEVADGHHADHRVIVVTFGAFDLVHPGHVWYLEKAKALGEVLIVGITSDIAIRQVKGPMRPINSEEDRAVVVAGFSSVDHVFIFNSDDSRFIEMVRPHICVYSESSEKKMSERKGEIALLQANGGRAVCFPETYSRHSSDIARSLVTA